jgi:hypothetical protein
MKNFRCDLRSLPGPKGSFALVYTGFEILVRFIAEAARNRCHFDFRAITIGDHRRARGAHYRLFVIQHQPGGGVISRERKMLDAVWTASGSNLSKEDIGAWPSNDGGGSPAEKRAHCSSPLN